MTAVSVPSVNEHHVVDVSTWSPAEWNRLSFYTLCKLADRTMYVTPHLALGQAIRRGEFKGRLTLDGLGNYIAFE